MTKSIGDEFRLEEYKSLRKETLLVLEHGWKIFQYTIAFCLAFFGWIVVHRNSHEIPDEIWKIVIWVPAGASVVSLMLGMAAYEKISRISHYIRTHLERHFDKDQAGWETYLKKNSIPVRYWERGLTYSICLTSVAWLMLILSNCALAYLLC
jgi:hypothetical protein